ncbi:MAG TPA: hypothetical protein VNC78_00255 [Actinomycetota bacterium]|nr:hypothetical protein [Actinomycetota bacterium]
MRALLALIAFAGMVAGHSLAYLSAAANPGERAELLAATGHGYWPWVAVLAAAAGAGASAAILGMRYARARRAATVRLGFAAIGARLALLQCVSFVTLEAVERALSGHGSLGWTDAVLWAGIALQLVVAVAGSALVILLSRIADRLAHRAASPLLETPTVVTFVSPPQSVRSARPGSARPGNPRGPPALTFS